MRGPEPWLVKKAKLYHATPHGLRHTYASVLLIAGTDVYYVSRMLGHASIQETVDTYGRWLPRTARAHSMCSTLRPRPLPTPSARARL